VLKYFITTKQLNQRQAWWAKVLAKFYFLIVYCPGFKNMFVNTLSCYKQDIGRQKALEKAYCTQVLFTPDKLDLEIICRLLTDLVAINSSKAFIILINSHVFLDLIDYILIINKQLFSLADKCAKIIRDN
jgi:hypothetical protein